MSEHLDPTKAQLEALEASNWIRSERGWEVLRDFARLLRMPNVTGSVSDLRANAAELAQRFQSLGAKMEIVELTGASPVVVGELRSERPTATLGVYVHYDGQPVDPEQWTTPPFSATLASGSWDEGAESIEYPLAGDPIDPDWRIYARGASDDKTPFAAMSAAVQALDSAGLDRAVDLVFLFEGEEESGSPNLDRYLRELTGSLEADAWLLCDGPVHQTRKPQISFGVRGYSGFELIFYGPEQELHSGHYGNWVPNPALELASFLDGCKNEHGIVTIDRFYDDTRSITEAERRAIEKLPAIEATLRGQLGFAGAEVTEGSYAERMMLPSFNVRGLRAADVGQSARNVIPSEAAASVDIRLAAGDDPDRMLDRVEAHLEAQGYTVLDRDPTPEERRRHRRLAKMIRTPGYPAVRTPMDSPLAGTLLTAARVAAGGEVIALPTFGGSIPLHHFDEILDAPMAIVPIANHDNNQHAADENVRIANLWYGIDLWATLLTTDFSALRSR